jgi:hypothetical protein
LLRSTAAALGIWIVALALAPHNSWAHVGFSTDSAKMLATSGGSESKTGGLIVAAGEYIHDRIPAGSTIAWSEMGYDTYRNLDKRFFDVHGLTERVLAMQPARYKQRIGFTDRKWRDPKSPLHKALVRTQPDYVMVIVPMGAPTPDLMLGPRRYKCVDVLDNYYSEKKRRLAVSVYQPI